jgi:hypothetical protein
MILNDKIKCRAQSSKICNLKLTCKTDGTPLETGKHLVSPMRTSSFKIQKRQDRKGKKESR